jgi:hypothetical protein
MRGFVIESELGETGRKILAPPRAEGRVEFSKLGHPVGLSGPAPTPRKWVKL